VGLPWRNIRRCGLNTRPPSKPPLTSASRLGFASACHAVLGLISPAIRLASRFKRSAKPKSLCLYFKDVPARFRARAILKDSSAVFHKLNIAISPARPTTAATLIQALRRVLCRALTCCWRAASRCRAATRSRRASRRRRIAPFLPVHQPTVVDQLIQRFDGNFGRDVILVL